MISLVFAFCALTSSSQVLIKNAHVVEVIGKKILTGYDVVVLEGKIISVDKGDQKGWGQRHGYIRGWIKTGSDGSYKLYTLVPASYPNSNNPKHIHPIIKESGKSEYWIDEFVFDNDPLLPAAERSRSKPVGGSGLLKPVIKDGILEAKRDIILGLNVKQYPK